MSLPKPYYDHAGVTIYHGDCRELLPKMDGESFDCAVTSPPYNTLPTTHAPSGLHGERKSGVNKWIKKAAEGYFDAMPELDYQRMVCAVVQECLRVCRGIVWINHKVRFRGGVGIHPVRFIDAPLYSEVVWDRAGSMALNCRRFSPSHECFYGFGSPHYWNDEGNKMMSVWRIPPQLSELHPCPYPVVLPLRLIQAACPEAGVVFDPFLGSGTTAVAAKQLNRKCIGIEIEERYCEIAANRCQQEVFDFVGDA